MINKLPLLSDPVKYAGLYIFDFGDHVAVGYTAEEIEFLLADPKSAKGTVYKIYRAYPNGTLEIRGVNPLMWNLSTGLIFWFKDHPEAIEAYEKLKSLASDIGPPGDFDLFLVNKLENEFPYALVMRYIREIDDAIAAWLLKINYHAGQHVEAGTKLITQLLANSTELLRECFDAESFRKSRTRQEVLEATDQPIQR
ncbi:MAG: hypothetical protein WC975_08090 [Phycisphaerae bacterium]